MKDQELVYQLMTSPSSVVALLPGCNKNHSDRAALYSPRYYLSGEKSVIMWDEVLLRTSHYNSDFSTRARTINPTVAFPISATDDHPISVRHVLI